MSVSAPPAATVAQLAEQAGALVVTMPGEERLPLRLIRCCPQPGCRQRVQLAGAGVRLHWAEDGTQCPGSWPPYVAGAPQPASARGPVTHPIRRRR